MSSQYLQAVTDEDLNNNLRALRDRLHGSDNETGLSGEGGHNLVTMALDYIVEAQNRFAETHQRLEQLERLAVTDELTGLLNRRGFEQRLNQEMAASQRHKEEGVLLYVDLDGFKPVNDAFGHAAGDEVLRTVAEVLQKAVRETDVIGRLGGDEFALLMPRTQHHHGLARATQLKKDLNSAYANFCGEMIAVRASVGIRPYLPGETWKTVLNMADMAMYEQKTATYGTDRRRQAEQGLAGVGRAGATVHRR